MHLPSNSLDNYMQKNMHNNYTSTVDIVLYFFKMAFTKKNPAPLGLPMGNQPSKFSMFLWYSQKVMPYPAKRSGFGCLTANVWWNKPPAGASPAGTPNMPDSSYWDGNAPAGDHQDFSNTTGGFVGNSRGTKDLHLDPPNTTQKW